jgi:hypothetical protein
MGDWARRALFASMLGAVIGVLVGLGLARLLWPAPAASALPSPSPADVRPEATPSPAATVETDRSRDEAVVMVSALYALDGDLERARERLLALGVDDAAAPVAELALRHAAAGNHQLATDLATLAAALGSEQGELLAYVATATPTTTPMPSPTSTPIPSATPAPTPTPMPSSTPSRTPAPTRRPPTRPLPTATAVTPAATPWTLEWDYRVSVLEPPVKLVPADVAPGQFYWRLVRLEWWKPGEGGNTLIYITAVNEKGQPVWGQEVVVENGEHTVLYTNPKPGEPYGANFPMFSTLNSYQVFVGGELPSDRVTGLGLGVFLGGTDHTTFVLVFQRSKK